MEKKKHETLEEILTTDPEFSEADVQKRTQSIYKTFRILMIIVGSMILLLVLSGLIFGGKA